jgi:SNF2 family DNA or RNA helicase
MQLITPKRRLYTPRPYQPLITNHILDNKRCGIWARMGLGKTGAVLTALDILYLSGIESLPSLVLAPLRVAASTWPEEAAKWDHLRHVELMPIIGDAPTRELALKKALRSGNFSMFSMNYENIPWLMDFLKHQPGGFKWPFGTVVADESTKLKGFRSLQGAKRARLLASVAHRDCTRWINLTGTPSPNGLKDLWGQTWYLDGGERLGRSFKAFSERWFYKSHDGYGIEPQPFAQKQIQDRLSDLCVSLDPADYFNLEDPIETVIEVDISEKARALYNKMEREMFIQIKDVFKNKTHDVEALNAAARTMKCLQLANGAAYVDGADEETGKAWIEVHRAKLDALEDIIEEAAGAPILVAYHFKSDLARLKKRFPQGRVLDKKPSTIAEWNAGKIPVLFAHPASAGHGLNLQDGGNILVFFSVNWNLEEHEQIIERIGPVRQMQSGHDRPVFIYYIMVKKTIERHVKRRLETKKGVQDILMDAMRAGNIL